MINPLILDQLTNQAMKALDAGNSRRPVSCLRTFWPKPMLSAVCGGAAYSVAAFHWANTVMA
jgi:hypothetical protein